MNPLKRLAALGQSVYLDEISRPMIESGALARLIADDDLQGVTSNPAIFEKAIGQSADYDDAIANLARSDLAPDAIFETLAVEDIRAAADLFAETHRASDGLHGYVSLEVSPLLADDTEGTIDEARRLWTALGQSVYLDEISRPMIESGDLARLIEHDDLQGVTSNPAIFEKAIGQSADYDDAIAELARSDLAPDAIFETLAVEDIRAAADLFAETHRASDGLHGYVSLEVSPLLADDTEGTIDEARRLWTALDRPNVFVKVPGTAAGLIAVRRLTAEGINLNVTLLFGLPRYQAVAEAYIAGLEDRAAAGEDVSGVSSVASFFLSRIDVMIDARLDAIIGAGGEAAAAAAALRGRAAVASAKRAFVIASTLFGGDRFAPLAAAGARPQRLLWASTGVKDPSYHDLAYVEPLVGPDTVTTLPRDTLDAYRDHGDPKPRLTEGLSEAETTLRALAGLGIDLDEATAALEREGVEKFVKPYGALMSAIERAMERSVPKA